MRQSPTRIRHWFCLPFTLREPGGRGSFVSATAADSTLFFTRRSSLLTSRSACGVMTTSYINLTSAPQLVDEFCERTSGLVFCFLRGLDYVLVFEPFTIFFKWNYDGSFFTI